MERRQTLTQDDAQLFDKDADRLMSAVSAAKYLDVKPQTIRKWVCAGRLKPFGRLGNHLRFRKRDLDAMIADA
jgi:excisionase family DNA binding protein